MINITFVYSYRSVNRNSTQNCRALDRDFCVRERKSIRCISSGTIILGQSTVEQLIVIESLKVIKRDKGKNRIDFP